MNNHDMSFVKFIKGQTFNVADSNTHPGFATEKQVKFTGMQTERRGPARDRNSDLGSHY